MIIPIAIPRCAREGLRIGHAVKARDGTLRPVAAYKGGLNRLRPRLGITGIRNAARDPEGIGAVMGRLELCVVAVAGGKILARFVLQRRRRQDTGIAVLGVPELHLHLEVDAITIPDADRSLSAVRLRKMSTAFTTSSKAGSARKPTANV